MRGVFDNITKKHGKAFFALCLCVFLLLLACNSLTGLFTDDYVYLGSFATGEKIKSVLDIFPSMAAHARVMNGRTISHFLVQFFLLLPTPVFDVINSVALVLLLVLICKIGSDGKNNSPFIFPAVFSAIWIFTEDFGQVVLWTDGACNYLFGAVIGLLFLFPFAAEYLSGKKIKTLLGKILFILLGFVAGGYVENTSAAVIFISVLLLVLTAVKKRAKPSVADILATISAMGGFLFMALAPAELDKKLGGLSLGDLRRGFVAALEMLKCFKIILFFLAVLFVLAVQMKISKDKIILSAVFAAGAVFANLVMTPASYYPPRASFFVLVLLVCACAVLSDEILRSGGNAKIFVMIAFVILFICAIYYIFIGANDIYETYLLQKANRETIESLKASGVYDILLQIISPKTKYSAVYGLKYLDTCDASTWPNLSMASYYGVNTIIGIN